MNRTNNLMVKGVAKEGKEEHYINKYGRACFRLEEQAPKFHAPAFYRGQEI